MLPGDFVQIINGATFVSGKISKIYSSFYLIGKAEGCLSLCEIVLQYNYKNYTVVFACCTRDGYICDVAKFDTNPCYFRGSSTRTSSAVLPSLDLPVLQINGSVVMYDNLSLRLLNSFVLLSNIYNNNVAKIDYSFSYFESLQHYRSTPYTRKFDEEYGKVDEYSGSSYRVEFQDFVLWGHVRINSLGFICNFDYGTTHDLVPLVSSELYRLVTVYNDDLAKKIGVKNPVNLLVMSSFIDFFKRKETHKVFYSGIAGGVYYINHKYRDNKTGDIGFWEGKMLNPPMVSFVGPDGVLKSRYETISIDYIIKDGKILKDNTEPFQFGLDDMFNLSFVK